MTSWIEAIPQLAIAALVLFVPGTLLLLAAGAPWRRAASFAPPASVGAVGLLGILADLAGVRFGLPVVAATTVIASLLLAGCRLGLRRLLPSSTGGAAPVPSTIERRGAQAGRDLSFVGAVAIPVVVLGRRLGSAIGSPHRISQTYDAVFHLNTTRYIVETGVGSSLRLARWGAGTGGFYPAAWHDLAALVAVNGDVVVATQALGLVVGALVWPVSMLVLVRRLLGPRRGVLFATAAVLSGLTAFPARMLDYGVLYPFLLGIALTPAVITVALIALSPRRERGDLHGIPLLVVAGSGILGLALAHTGVLLALLLLVSPYVVIRGFEFARERWEEGRRVSTAMVAVVVLVVALEVARVVNGSQAVAVLRTQDWPARVTPIQAVGAWLTSSPHNFGIPWVFAALVLLGIGVALATRGLRWLVVAHFLVAVPYVFAAGVDSDLSQLISGFWYNDATRIGALYPLTAAPLAATGLAWLASRVWAVVVPRAARLPWLLRGRRLYPVTVGLVTVGLLVTMRDPSLQQAYASLARVYSIPPTAAAQGTLLSADEWTLLQRLPSLIPPGSRVADNPWNGSALAYAVSNVPVMVPQLSGYPTGDPEIVADGLARATESPAVCRSLERLRIRYVLDFGPPLWIDDRYWAYPGLTGLSTSPAVRLMDQVGGARLYEITACGDVR